MDLKSQAVPIRVVIRYILLQLPVTILIILAAILIQQWFDIQGWLVWGLAALWVIKDIILFPFVWRAYDSKGCSIADSMIGMQGITNERLEPSGYIRVNGELWHAEVAVGADPIDKNVKVRILKHRGLILIVAADNTENR